MIQPKRLVVCILIIMVVLNTPIVFAAGLQDVEDTKYEEAVEYLRLKGIMKGYPDGTFRPDDCITRAEFAVIAVLTKGLSSAETVQGNSNMGEQNQFRDVPADHWAYGYISTATNAGLLSGYGNGEFGTNDELTYCAAVTVLVRMLGAGPEVDKMGLWPTNYIIYATEKGLIKNVEIEDWLACATRGDVAIMVYNTLQILGEVYAVSPDSVELKLFAGNETKRDYVSRFAQQIHESIGIELKIEHSESQENEYLPITYRLTNNVNNACLWTKTVIYQLEPDTNKTVFTEELSWCNIDSIRDGKYRIEVYSNNLLLAKKDLEIYTDRSYEVDLIRNYIEVKSLKFFGTHSNAYEHDVVNFNPENRVYQNEFTPGYYNQCIWWDLTIEFPAIERDIDFPIEFKYFRGKGKTLWGHHTIADAKLYEGQTFANFVGGIYAENYDRWLSGTYTVEIYVFGEKLAEGTFRVVRK